MKLFKNKAQRHVGTAANLKSFDYLCGFLTALTKRAGCLQVGLEKWTSEQGAALGYWRGNPIAFHVLL